MSSSLQSYYLQQMGIPLWELRLPSAGTDSPDTSASATVTATAKVLILVEEALEEGREKSLFRQMLFSVGLSEADIVLRVLPCEHFASFFDKSIRVIMVLGDNTSDCYEKIKNKEMQERPSVVSFSPKHLLHCGQDKKQAYRDWLRLKELYQGR